MSSILNQNKCNCGISAEAKQQTHQGVLVFAEQREGKIMSIALQLLGEGKKLAEQLGVPLSAVLVGYKISANANELFEYGEIL